MNHIVWHNWVTFTFIFPHFLGIIASLTFALCLAILVAPLFLPLMPSLGNFLGGLVMREYRREKWRDKRKKKIIEKGDIFHCILVSGDLFSILWTLIRGLLRDLSVLTWCSILDFGFRPEGTEGRMGNLALGQWYFWYWLSSPTVCYFLLFLKIVVPCFLFRFDHFI